MKQSTALANRLREVILDGKWIANTNCKEVLDQITWEQANQKVSSLNTILALTYHLNYYLAGVLAVLKGGELTIRDKYSFDHQAIQTAEDWEKLLADFWSNAEEFAQQVELLSDEQLDAVFVKETYGTYRRNIDAIIEHTYYHFGQISLIKKMVLMRNVS